MAVLMRRLITDAQAKLRRMVEEHSANLAARIDTDYPNSIPAPIPDPACFADDIQISNSTHLGQVPDDVPSFIPKPLLNAEEPVSIAFALADADSVSESKRSTLISSRPSSIESRRSKSLCNTSSLDSSEDARAKSDVKKTKSNPVKSESLNITIDSPPHDDAKADDAFEDNASASARDSRSSPDTQSSEKQESPKAGCSAQRENDSSSPRSPKNLEPGQAAGAAALAPSPSGSLRTNAGSTIRRLRLENERLQAEITRLRRLVVAGASSILTEKASSGNPDEPSDRALEMELQLAKEALITLKSDRRRLKAEKFDLLNQMKQLYATLEDKEKELRDFIRNYEQRVRDNETSLQQLSTEREERERERWSLLRHARDEAERSLSLAAQLNAKELQLQQAQEQLQDARRQLASSGCLSDQESLASLPRHSINGGALTPGSGGLLSGHHGIGFLPGDRGSCSADSGVRVTSDRESGANSVAGNLSDSTIDGTPAINIEGSNGDGDSTSIVSSIAPSHIYQSVSTKDCSPTLSPLNANSFSRSVNAGVLSRSVEQLSSPLDPEPISVGRRLKHSSHSRLGGGRGGTWGSISRVFARSRHRNKTNSLQENSEYTFESHRSWSPLSEEGYAEKLRLLREASSIPMEKWRAPTVLAWLEVALGMPQYGSRCAENIKSGKVLLELSDLELECGLGITHPMHRKKVRLAIEEHRQPSLVRYPCIAQLGHTWVASEWLSDLGLSQYAENFAGNLVDARMLEHLSKKELEKYLGITRKFHQASIVHGIHLLRIMKYDRQALAVRRHQCENVDADPLVWTNQRFIRWTRSIDLSEYADNLKESGVHGGLVVLEPSFNGDTMATALGIPASKNIIRRHLNAELEALVLPARSTLEHYVRVKTCVLGGGSLGRSFSRSCAGLVGPPPGTPGSRDQSYLTPGSRRTSLKGSISRAFGSITKSTSSNRSERSEPEKQSPTSSECSSVISRTSFSLHQFRSSRSGGESPIYSTPFAHQNNIYNRRSEEYDSYAHSRALQEEYEMNHHSSHNVNISPNEKNKSFGNNTNSIHRSHNKKRQHRRVKSIGDIDVIHIEPV